MIRINSLELENVKRIKAVKMDLGGGLNIIGGDNGQGKTSVLDAIAYVLGGEKYRPSNVKREGSLIPPEMKITLSNGLLVERKGKKSALRVTDPAGNQGNQSVLNSFLEVLALDLSKFLNSSATEKAKILLGTLGIDESLMELEKEIKRIYEDRKMQGRILDQKKKFTDELPVYNDVPETPVNAAELIKQQQDIFKRNGDNQRKRDDLGRIKQQYGINEAEIENLQKRLDSLLADNDRLSLDIETAESENAGIVDVSTESIERQLDDIEGVNVKVRANLDKQHAQDEVKALGKVHTDLEVKLKAKRDEKMKLLDGADLPLEGLTVSEGQLLYNKQQWDCMSGSEQLKVATAIVRKLNPECGFVLIDKLEQMDNTTVEEFGEWLNKEGLQAICTRVSKGAECSIIIEDGTAELKQETPTFQKGTF